MDTERLHWHLENWALYMRSDSHKLGYPSKSAGFLGAHNAACEDGSEIVYECEDLNSAKTMDAIIDSLVVNQRCAINHVWLHSVFVMRDFEHTYDMAMDNLLTIAGKRLA